MAKRRKKAAVTAAVAAVASAGVLVGGVFAAPEELLDAPAPAILEAGDESAAAEDGEAARSPRRTLRERCRSWVLALPWGVRAAVGLPLWGVGWLLCSLFQLLCAGVLSPLGGALARGALLAAALAGAFVLSAKAAFPGLPLKRILCRRSLLPLLGGLCVLGAAQALLPLFWKDCEGWLGAVGPAGSCLLLLIALWRLGRREARGRRRAQAAAPETQQQALRRVRELADSVR